MATSFIDWAHRHSWWLDCAECQEQLTFPKAISVVIWQCFVFTNIAIIAHQSFGTAALHPRHGGDIHSMWVKARKVLRHQGKNTDWSPCLTQLYKPNPVCVCVWLWQWLVRNANVPTIIWCFVQGTNTSLLGLFITKGDSWAHETLWSCLFWAMIIFLEGKILLGRNVQLK